jgi:aryl-alcohol dehydrogenase-like predicted oxidoreductase
VIIGVRTMAQLDDNLGALDVQLQAAEMSDLNQVSALQEGYPYRFLKQYGVREAK